MYFFFFFLSFFKQRSLDNEILGHFPHFLFSERFWILWSFIPRVLELTKHTLHFGEVTLGSS